VLVGDLIQAVREAITDQPQTLAIPTLTAVPTTGGSFAPASYFLVATMFTPWGETLPSNEVNVALSGANNAFQVTVLGPLGLLPSFVTKIRIYIGEAAGQETAYFDLPFVTANPQTVPALGSVQSPPSRNSAYLPDTDGDAINASTMFRWLNDALKLASQVCGGLLDYSGVGSVSGAPQYIVPGQWKKIASLWYDGYPLAMDDNGNYFRRNAITASVLSSGAMSTFNNQMMIELWPQPSRTAAITTLAVPLLIGQLTATLASTAGFLLTNGFVNIAGEIMSYSGISGNTLNNLQRALSGTTQSVIPAGSIAQELNLFWSGWRVYNPNFQPGNSLSVIPVPIGWESILFEYGLGRMKLAEQNVGDYSKLTDSCIKKFSDWLRTNKVVVGPRQVGDQTSGLECLPNLGGGWVIP
jgi:hypothetical protein